MLGWQLFPSYSPLLGLLAGIFTGLGLTGFGYRLLRWMRIALPEPWQGATGYLLGILTAELAIEAIAMAHVATRPVLIGAWILLTLPWILPIRNPLPRSAVVWILLALHLVVSMAPLTHQDELVYHAIVPSRIVADAGLQPYRMPWEATVGPQISWDILQAPFFAMGLPSASSVLSWWTLLMLAWFVWTLVVQQTGSSRWAALSCVALLAQGFSISVCTSMGPHVFGYFATLIAILAAFGFAEQPASAWIVPIACAAMISGKLTMAPAALLICILRFRHRLLRPFAAFAIFLGPLIAWSWIATGSPLGIITAEIFHANFFDAETLSSYRAIAAQSLNSDTFLPLFEAANWSLPMWLGCAAFFIFRKRDAVWWSAAGLFIMQFFLLIFVIAWQLRFLGGIQYALAVAGILAYAANGRRNSRLWWIVAAPWFCLVVWMSSAFWRVSTALEPPRAFLERYSGLFSDYEQLDRTLPPDAVILTGRSLSDPFQMAWLSKPPVFYAPRPVFFNHLDIPRGKKAYLLWIHREGALDPWLPSGYRLGERVYSNPNARFYPSRNPSGRVELDRMDVYVLLD